jgi:hypothetical protein
LALAQKTLTPPAVAEPDCRTLVRSSRSTVPSAWMASIGTTSASVLPRWTARMSRRTSPFASTAKRVTGVRVWTPVSVVPGLSVIAVASSRLTLRRMLRPSASASTQ